jgi:hypothetical protein
MTSIIQKSTTVYNNKFKVYFVIMYYFHQFCITKIMVSGVAIGTLAHLVLVEYRQLLIFRVEHL